LSYTDNGDGTITDNNTGLMWEGKTTTCQGDIHCVDDTYLWAHAFTGFIATLNTAPCFAGHCDWRLPNVKELQSIVNYEETFPAVSLAFNNNCQGSNGLTESCTAASDYWSSSSVAGEPSFAWDIGFGSGLLFKGCKNLCSHRVRAVRGGLSP
jgi:hypothetical protein